jgi:hypothetical protein
MAHKLYDLTVKTGEYTNSQGETKGRYENVGSVMQGDNGQFVILKRTFNPAGVPNPDGKDSVLLSCFEPQQGQQNNQQQAPMGGVQQYQQPQQQYQQQPMQAPQQRAQAPHGHPDNRPQQAPQGGSMIGDYDSDVPL